MFVEDDEVDVEAEVELSWRQQVLSRFNLKLGT